MTTLKYKPKTQNPKPATGNCTLEIRSRKPTVRWSDMKDSEVLERAQEAVNKTGLADPDSFRTVFRGITAHLWRHGYTPEDLDFSFGKPPRREAPMEPTQNIPVWDQMTDEQVLQRAQEVINSKGHAGWKQFSSTYKGIRYQIFRRHLQRDDLVFRE